MIHRRHHTRRKRTPDPFLRGQQDAILYGEPKNPFRHGTDESKAYSAGYRDAVAKLSPGYESNRIPKD